MSVCNMHYHAALKLYIPWGMHNPKFQGRFLSSLLSLFQAALKTTKMYQPKEEMYVLLSCIYSNTTNKGKGGYLY